jgi:DNA-binding response OmpR family regulator
MISGGLQIGKEKAEKMSEKILSENDRSNDITFQSGEPQVQDPPRPRRKLRRLRDTASHLIIGALCLNCRTFDLQVGDRVVLLTPTEFELLYYLMSRAGQAFSAEQLLCQLWQYSPGAGRPELIRAHIKNLRIKIEQNPKEPAYLRTIWRSGYTISATEQPTM